MHRGIIMASASAPSPAPPSEVVVISHSTIFYWWPVWLVGFAMAALTYLDGRQMAVVPAGTVAERARAVEGHDGPRDVLVVPPGKHLPADRATGDVAQPRLRMAASNGLGVVFAVTLGLVIVITNIPLRGLWSVVVVAGAALVTVLLAALGWWDPILGALGVMDIHINGLGYSTIALFLLAIWLLAYFLYDRRNYLVFGQGQLRVRRAFGAGEVTHDTRGMTVEKHRDDVFRHWVLGLGSGDLTVKTAGMNAAQFEVPNVLDVDRKLERIKRALQEREVVVSRP
jgi:hypothetical protein